MTTIFEKTPERQEASLFLVRAVELVDTQRIYLETNTINALIQVLAVLKTGIQAYIEESASLITQSKLTHKMHDNFINAVFHWPRVQSPPNKKGHYIEIVGSSKQALIILEQTRYITPETKIATEKELAKMHRSQTSLNTNRLSPVCFYPPHSQNKGSAPFVSKSTIVAKHHSHYLQ